MGQLQSQGGVGVLVQPCQAQTQGCAVCLVVPQVWTHPQGTLGAQQQVRLGHITVHRAEQRALSLTPVSLALSLSTAMACSGCLVVKAGTPGWREHTHVSDGR